MSHLVPSLWPEVKSCATLAIETGLCIIISAIMTFLEFLQELLDFRVGDRKANEVADEPKI